MLRTFYILICLVIVTGCSMFKPHIRPDAPIDLPEHFSLPTSGASGPDRWWEAFGSGELNRLVAEAFAHNFDIRTAWARLKQADAAARKAGRPVAASLAQRSAHRPGRPVPT